MSDRSDQFEGVEAELRKLQNKKDNRVAAYSVRPHPNRASIYLSWVGEPSEEVGNFLAKYGESVCRDPILEEYYFLSSELRPGSGLIRVVGGQPEGPGGTLTCLLSSKDGQDTYFVAAGHVLTNFWRAKPDRPGSIYRYRKGFPATDSTRFLGKCIYLPEDSPTPLDRQPRGKSVRMDIGIVKLEARVELKQRTTCYGSFGEWPPDLPIKVKRGKEVMKCGSQETHWTKACIKEFKAVIPIYGPNGQRYLFRNQFILESMPESGTEEDKKNRQAEAGPVRTQGESRKDCEPREELRSDYPRNSPCTPFAVPGDSGTMIVDKETKRPVGMLIAGSILSGRYVMTPFKTIKKFWEDRSLTMLRA